ncbi:unnamed protein product [Microthlaspi erraticum]|uniref:Uncharacterized protein n=1 Tax=Microthlaspi erraticum TaxID=1685480 RepID=A0A6D2HE60_9BRAS|nr:unnamed protein product [Microthlaspi erraticum]
MQKFDVGATAFIVDSSVTSSSSITALNLVQLDHLMFDSVGATTSTLSLQFCLLEHLEHMGREEQGRTWCMDAAQLDTQRKKEEAILKTSSTTYSTTGRVPQLDRPSFNSIELRSQQSNPKNVASPLTSL